MSLFVIASDSPELSQKVHRATDGRTVELPHGPLPADPAHFFARLDDPTPPKVVVLDSRNDPAGALRLAGAFDEHCRSVSVVLVSDDPADIGLAAMRAGVRDILVPEADAAELRLVLDRALQVAMERSAASDPAAGSEDPARTSRVISVVSPKGGVGKTTVSTNIAVGLARAVPNSTVLVDLDVQFGDVASALDLEPEYALPDAVHGPASRDAMVLKTFLTLHSTGLYVIAGPKSPADADSITGEDISRLIQVLASEFKYVVIDTAPGLSEHSLAAMDETTDLVLVTSLDVPGIRGMRKELDTLTDLGMGNANRHIVINMADTRGGLTIADVESTLGTTVDVLLPRSRAATASVNQGVPLLQSGLRDPLTKQLQRLVSRFGPTGKSASKASRRWASRSRNGAEADVPKPRRAKPGWYPGVKVGA
jgi:pilus assembly protein CpaE